VIDKPDNNNNAVFNMGIPQGFKTTIFIGGQIIPKSIEGDKLE
jgi:hypothetical protein